MPYEIRKGKGKKPYEIVRKADGKVVGTSTSAGKAYASVQHRMSGEKK